MFNNHHRYEDPGFLPGWLSAILQLLLLLFIIVTILRIVRGWLPMFAYGDWQHLLDNFTYSPKEFYEKLQQNLKETKIDGITYDWEDLHEGTHFVSATRLYLKITWKEKLFYVCAAPFGRGFFISWWHFEKTPLWERILLMFGRFGRWITLSINPMTFYRIDTAAVFQRYMHDTVMKTMEDITKEKGVRLENVAAPNTRDVFNRK